MNIFEMEVYKLSMEIGEKVYAIVRTWDFFEKDTTGKQLVKAVDSVAANLSEGFGRYHIKDKVNFGYYSRGSLYETRTWLEKARNRDLINQEKFNELKEKINITGRLLNGYIKSIGKFETQGDMINEPEGYYYKLNKDIFPDE